MQKKNVKRKPKKVNVSKIWQAYILDPHEHKWAKKQQLEGSATIVVSVIMVA